MHTVTRKIACECSSTMYTADRDYLSGEVKNVWTCTNCMVQTARTTRKARTSGQPTRPQQRVIDSILEAGLIIERSDWIGGDYWVTANNNEEHILLNERYIVAIGNKGKVTIKRASRIGGDDTVTAALLGHKINCAVSIEV